ncbi:MAG: phosphopantothenoylcysteine decarboxylase, partial [Planctomycetes bacterium]|nr:phosphopantothenoylcysteine decarboxylase [Planctomycetota bacterium]
MQKNPSPRILITAGPTAEDIDPVRFICNRSTGRMGVEVALAVKQAGGLPRLILGPTHLNPPDGIETIRVRSAADMHREVVAGLAWADGLVMTAAVADYTPAEPLTAKL